MGDESQQNAPQPDSGDAGEVISEEDLDALLSEASELAAEISGDMGEPDPNPLAAPEGITGDPSLDEFVQNSGSTSESHSVDDDIDLKLADVDEMLSQTQHELGTPAISDDPSTEAQDQTAPPVSGVVEPEDARATALPPSVGSTDEPPVIPAQPADPGATRSDPEDAEAPAETIADNATVEDAPYEPTNAMAGLADDLVDTPKPDKTTGSSQADVTESATPDFMDDLTRPDVGSEGGPPPPAPGDGLPYQGDPESLQATSLDDDSIPSLDDASSDAGEVAATPARPKPGQNANRAAVLQRISRSVGSTAGRLSPVALQVVGRGVGVLEIFNHPLRRLGTGPREVLGWLAIATLATSMLVLVISLF